MILKLSMNLRPNFALQGYEAASLADTEFNVIMKICTMPPLRYYRSVSACHLSCLFFNYVLLKCYGTCTFSTLVSSNYYTYNAMIDLIFKVNSAIYIHVL